MTAAAEATAPCRVDLAGGMPGVLTLTVAIDRRSWCRVEPMAEGVVLESRDALRKATGRSVAELVEDGTLGGAARVLRAMGLEAGVRVVTQSRVPAGSGLGESVALGAAVAAAAAGLVGKALDPAEIALLAVEAERAGALREGHTAVRGGALALHPDGAQMRAEALAVDPTRIEECLLLVQAERPSAPPRADARVLQDVAGRVLAALGEGRVDDVIPLWAEEWDALRGPGWPSAGFERAARVVREAGGAARPCGAGEGGLLAVWAPPGARGSGRHEAVLHAAKAAGLRLFPARVDLRGLEIG